MDVRGGPEITIYFHNKGIRLLRQYSAVNVERVGDYAKQMALNDSTVFRERKNSSKCRVTGRETGHGQETRGRLGIGMDVVCGGGWEGLGTREAHLRW